MKTKAPGRLRTVMVSIFFLIIMALTLFLLMIYTQGTDTAISIKDGFNMTDRLVVFRIFMYFVIVFSWPMIARIITKAKEDEKIRKSDYELIKSKQWHVAIILLLIELIIIQQLGF